MTDGQPTGSLPPAAIAAVAALKDDLRRRMYDHIRLARRPVTRDEAASVVGISRKLAAFHLEALVSAGVLRAHYDSGRPRRVGRAPKVYEPVTSEIAISLPERQYDVLAAILVDTVLDPDAADAASASAVRAADRRGRKLGTAERLRARPGDDDALGLAVTVLADHGYQPDRVGADEVALRNCPFHDAAQQAPELVCGINLAFLTGFLEGLDAPGVRAELVPTPGECCVRLRCPVVPGNGLSRG